MALGKPGPFHTALLISAPASARLAALLEMNMQCRAKLARDGIDLVESDYTFLVLSLSVPGCECAVSYKQPLDVPLHDVMCEHGNYLLKWENGDDKVEVILGDGKN